MTQKSRTMIFFKRHWSNILFFTLLAVLLFNADAKAWVLRQLFHAGLFRAEMPAKENKAGTTGAAQFTFLDQQHQLLQTEHLRGKTIFINFWAQWCPPCKAEMPSINALYQKLKTDDRFVFIMVDVDGNIEKSKQYMQSKGFDLPLYIPAGDLPAGMYDGTLPTTLVIDKDGNLAFKHEGIANYDTDDFLKKLQDL